MSIPRNGNGTTQACAACKYQRRKCAPDCVLAPFFPHYRQRQFLNAHKLFGVSNITKIIKSLDPSEKEEAMRTIIFQSDVRDNDPVGGCYRIIHDLQRQLEYCKAELDIVLHQLALCRAQAQKQHHPLLHISEPIDAIVSCETVSADLSNTFNSCSMQYQYLLPHQEHQDLQEDVGIWAMNDSLSTSSSFHVKNASASDFDDIKLDVPCERSGLKFEFDDLVDRSEEEAGMKGDNALLEEETISIHQTQDHDLKETIYHFPLCMLFFLVWVVFSAWLLNGPQSTVLITSSVQQPSSLGSSFISCTDLRE